MWYTREEQSMLNSLWYCMSGVNLMVRLLTCHDGIAD